MRESEQVQESAQVPDQLKCFGDQLRKVEVYPDPSWMYFLVNAGVVVYVGQSTNVHSRVLQHAKDGKIFDSAFCVGCEESELNVVEAVFIDRLQPVLNTARPRVFPGQGDAVLRRYNAESLSPSTSAAPTRSYADQVHALIIKLVDRFGEYGATASEIAASAARVPTLRNRLGTGYGYITTKSVSCYLKTIEYRPIDGRQIAPMVLVEGSKRRKTWIAVNAEPARCLAMVKEQAR